MSASLRDNASAILAAAAARNDTLEIELLYPRDNPIKFFEIGLMDVRAADNIRISYDFERDGWRIEQACVHEWTGEEAVECDPQWKEVAFVEAWASSDKPLPSAD